MVRTPSKASISCQLRLTDMNKSVSLGDEYLEWDLSPISFVVKGGTQVLPPKAELVEPDLPAWSLSESSEGVSTVSQIDPGAEKPAAEPYSGICGILVGLLIAWLKGRLGRR